MPTVVNTGKLAREDNRRESPIVKAKSRVLVLLMTATMLVLAETGAARELSESRAELERKLDTLASTTRKAPGDVDARRAYADALFKLGNIWQADDVMAPLITAESSDEWDLELVARIALLTMDLARAEILYAIGGHFDGR